MHVLTTYSILPDRSYESLGDYRNATGPSAAVLAQSRTPGDILDVLAQSGLRGRGGAGFPTARKWRSIAEHPCGTRFVVCNAAEGEPGTFKDRWLMRRNPYAVIEGMLIAARVVRARKLYIAIKASFREELVALRRALAELAAEGTVARDTIDIVEGPDAYLFGEEKALLEVIEGNEAMPREAHYPPYERGLFATPTCANPALVNNVQTFAHVPSIVRYGPAGFRALGTEDTPGTILYTVSGDVARPGVYEHEAGISLTELIERDAGGIPEGAGVKVVLPGVANRALVPHELDTPADFGSLAAIGSGLGAAGFLVFDDRRDALSITRAVARFLYVESCSHCSACKRGLGAASEGLDELATGDADNVNSALRQVVLSARSAPQGNRCYLPVQGAELIPSLVDLFRDELTRRRAPSDRGMSVAPGVALNSNQGGLPHDEAHR